MRCYICDKAMTEEEIQLMPDGKTYESCGSCMSIILEAAYSDGFIKEDPLDDLELEEQFGNGVNETLDLDTYQSTFDHGDYEEGDDYA